MSVSNELKLEIVGDFHGSRKVLWVSNVVFCELWIESLIIWVLQPRWRICLWPRPHQIFFLKMCLTIWIVSGFHPVWWIFLDWLKTPPVSSSHLDLLEGTTVWEIGYLDKAKCKWDNLIDPWTLNWELGILHGVKMYKLFMGGRLGDKAR